MNKYLIAVGESRFSTNWKNIELSWEDFLKRISNPIKTQETYEQFMKFDPTKQGKLKDVGGFVAGEIRDGRRSAQNIINRCMITLDADNIQPGKTDEILRNINAYLGCNYAVYSTRKHSSYKPRLRIIIPTDRLMTPDEYEPVARKIAKEWVGMEIMDKTTFDVNRLMYWPSCSKDSEFVFTYNTETRYCVSVDGILGLYNNWKDVDEWPKAPDELENIKKKIASIEKKQEDPTKKDNTVGTFCKVYDIHSAIAELLADVYEPRD